MTLFDLLIPLEMPKQATFVGHSGRGSVALNNEVSFTFGAWDASFHEFSGRSYFVLRLGSPLEELRAQLPSVFLRIARASAILDISIRPTTSPLSILTEGEHADLDKLNAFPSGEMPLAQQRNSDYQVGLPVEVLSDALGQELSLDDNVGAFRLFADVDFEATPDSRFVLLSSVLELLSERKARDCAAQELIDKWKTDAVNVKRFDLAQALDLMRSESVGSSVFALVTEAARAAGCTEDETRKFAKRAREAYRKRGRLLHAGVSVTKDELSTLRSIVRLVLAQETKGTAFTPIGNGAWEERGKFK